MATLAYSLKHKEPVCDRCDDAGTNCTMCCLCQPRIFGRPRNDSTRMLDEPNRVNPECEAKVHRVCDTDGPAGMVVKDESEPSTHTHMYHRKHTSSKY